MYSQNKKSLLFCTQFYNKLGVLFSFLKSESVYIKETLQLILRKYHAMFSRNLMNFLEKLSVNFAKSTHCKVFKILNLYNYIYAYK